MKKLIQVIHDLSAGGAETLVKDYSLLINKEKFEVKVICFYRRNSSYETLLDDNDIKVIYLSDYIKTDRTKSPFHNLIFTIKMFFKFKKILKEENPDIMHTHLPINTLIKFARPSKSITIFHTVHNEPTILWRKNSLIRRIDFIDTKWLVKHNNMRFIVLHDKMRIEINKLFNVDNSIILNNGIDFSRFDRKKIRDRNEFRKELKIPKEAFVIGHVGRFTEQKNHEMLVDIFDEIHKKNVKAFLLMIGTGDLREKIEEKLKKKGLEKFYLILSNRSDIPDLLNIFDYFVFPSKFEGLPVTLIEAQKMELPCFISDKISNYSIISNLVTVLPINISSKQWATAIIDYKYPDKLILNSEEWDMKNVIKKLEKIYLEEID